MENKTVSKNTKFIGIIPLLIAAYLAFNMIGCAGMEAYSSIGVRRVDEHRESQRTYNKPLKCLFIPCDNSQYSERSGS